MLIKLHENLGVDMWELFDYGHEVNITELKSIITHFIEDADEEKLRLIVRIMRAVLQ